MQRVGARLARGVFLCLLVVGLWGDARAQTLNVPDDYSDIQDAVDAATDGATILVAPGTYVGTVFVDGKNITLASRYFVSGDIDDIYATVLDGGGGASTVHARFTTAFRIIGFTIQNSSDGVLAEKTHLELLNCYIRDTSDGIDAEGKDALGSCVIRGCLFDDNSDDGIDLDDSFSAIIEDNIISNNGDDGIEIRLHEHETPTLDIIIRNNRIFGNGEDGIQIIGYGQESNRTFLIERNLIFDNLAAAVGLMDNADTVEDFRGAPVPDPMLVMNNVFDGHQYGWTGGTNVTFVNTVVMNNDVLGFKNLTGNSVVSHSSVWQNGEDFENSNLGPGIVVDDPLLGIDYRPLAGSPCIDAGEPGCLASNGTVCDIGRYEFGGSGNLAPQAALAVSPTSGDAPLFVQLDGAGSFDPDGQIVGYVWDFGDGNGATGAVTSHTYTSVGEFVVELAVTDDDGAADEATAFVEVTTPPANEPPMALPTASPLAGELPLFVTFDGSLSSDAEGPLALYGWDFGDGESATGVTASHTYGAEGTYAASLTVTDAGGLTDSAPLTITVIDPTLNMPPVSRFTATPTLGEAPLTVVLDGASSTDEDGFIVAYDWEFGDGMQGVGVTTSYTFTTEGEYSVTLAVTDDDGSTDTDTVLVTVLPAAGTAFVDRTVAASADDAEEDGAGSLTLISSDLELVVDLGEVQTVGLRFLDVAIPSGAEILEAWVQFQVDEASEGSTSLVLHAEASDDALPYTASGVDLAARPLTTATAGWLPPPWPTPGVAGPGQRTSDLSALIQEVIDRPGWAGSGAISLIITGSGSRTAEAFDGDPLAAPQLHVSYSETCVGFVADFSADTTQGCLPLKVRFADLSTGPDIDDWIWDFGDGSGSFEQHPVHEYTEDGTFSVSLTATSPDCSQSLTRTGYISVGSAPVAALQASEVSGAQPLQVSFSDTSTGGPGDSWLWDFGDGGQASVPAPVHVYEVPGVYTVSLTVQNACGMDTSTLVDLITVGYPPTIDRVSPGRGSTAGGESLVILGADLGGASVRVGGEMAPLTSVTPTRLVVTTPPGDQGPADVVVTTAVGSATAAGAYVYAEPVELGFGGAVGSKIVTVRSPVSSATDDAEERASGAVSHTSTDLEMVIYLDELQNIGLRFTGLGLPQGAAIVSASVQFRVDEATVDPASLTIRGQAADDAATFVSAQNNISSRPMTAAAVPWDPAPWTSAGDTAEAQQTPDLTAVIQEIVDRPGWSPGSALVLIVNGTGVRIAEAYNGRPQGAPMLTVAYRVIEIL